MKNYASAMITDMVNPDNKMFHSNSNPPAYVKLTTAQDTTDIVRTSIARITKYLSQWVEYDNFQWYRTNSIMSKDSGVLNLDKHTLLVQLGYKNGPDRIMTFHLKLAAADLRLK